MFYVSVRIFMGLIYGLSGQTQARPPHDPPTCVSKIAQIAGPRVGYDTRAEMKRRLGEGTTYTGGHAGGARYGSMTDFPLPYSS